jgi:hypothetical protein
MKNSLILLGILFLTASLSAQKYSTKNGFVGFYSHTPVEDVKGNNNQVNSILDTSTGDIVFLLLNKSFHFDRALMEEHFNENYMESEKFPKSTFKGKITNLSEVNFAKPGVYNVKVQGEMNMHGVTNAFTTTGTIEVLENAVLAKSKFTLKPEDYGIIIPGIVREKIAKEMEVTVDIRYTPISK